MPPRDGIWASAPSLPAGVLAQTSSSKHARLHIRATGPNTVTARFPPIASASQPELPTAGLINQISAQTAAAAVYDPSSETDASSAASMLLKESQRRMQLGQRLNEIRRRIGVTIETYETTPLALDLDEGSPGLDDDGAFGGLGDGDSDEDDEAAAAIAAAAEAAAEAATDGEDAEWARLRGVYERRMLRAMLAVEKVQERRAEVLRALGAWVATHTGQHAQDELEGELEPSDDTSPAAMRAGSAEADVARASKPLVEAGERLRNVHEQIVLYCTRQMHELEQEAGTRREADAVRRAQFLRNSGAILA